MKFGWILIVLSLLIATTGCKRQAAPDVAETVEPSLPTRAQPTLPIVKLRIGGQEMAAECALTGIQQQTGMMFRTNLDENAGMLFVFPQPFRASFWMKNCPLPMSAAYIDPNGRILEIRDLEPHNTNSVVANSENVMYVIEANRGWFDRNNIYPGTMVRTEFGSLGETFFGRGRSR